MSETRDPDTDQDAPLPAGEDAVSAHDIAAASLRSRPDAVALILERKELGLRKYGVILHHANGRDIRRDVLEELADAVCYAHLTDNMRLIRVTEAALLIALNEL